MLGPIEILVIEFPGNKFRGEIMPALNDLVDSKTISIVDGLFVMKELWKSVPSGVLVLIVLGGLVYSGGVIFHLSPRRYSRALWHGCVLVGATFHYFAIAALVAA